MNYKDLEFIIEYFLNDINISHDLIKKLIKDKKMDLLQIIFKKFKFYDNDLILNLLFHYRNKTPMSTSYLI